MDTNGTPIVTQIFPLLCPASLLVSLKKSTPWSTKIPVLLLEPRKWKYLNNSTMGCYMLYILKREEKWQRAINMQSWRHYLILSSDSIFHNEWIYTQTKMSWRLLQVILRGTNTEPVIRVIRRPDSSADIWVTSSCLYSLMVWPWTSHWTSLLLSFLIHKMRIIIVPTPRIIISIKCVNEYKF